MHAHHLHTHVIHECKEKTILSQLFGSLRVMLLSLKLGGAFGDHTGAELESGVAPADADPDLVVVAAEAAEVGTEVGLVLGDEEGGGLVFVGDAFNDVAGERHCLVPVGFWHGLLYLFHAHHSLVAAHFGLLPPLHHRCFLHLSLCSFLLCDFVEFVPLGISNKQLEDVLL